MQHTELLQRKRKAPDPATQHPVSRKKTVLNDHYHTLNFINKHFMDISFLCRFMSDL